MSVYSYINQAGTLHVQSDDATSTFALKSFIEQEGLLRLRVLDTWFALRTLTGDEQTPTQYPTPAQPSIEAPAPVSGPRIGINDGVAQEDEIVRGLRSRINDLIRDNTRLRERGERLNRDCLILQGKLQDANRRGTEAQQRVKELEEELAGLKGPQPMYQYAVEVSSLGIKVGDRELIDGDELKLGDGVSLFYRETRSSQLDPQPHPGFKASMAAIQNGIEQANHWKDKEHLTYEQIIRRASSSGFNDSFKLGAFKEVATAAALKLNHRNRKLRTIKLAVPCRSPGGLRDICRSLTTGVDFNDE